MQERNFGIGLETYTNWASAECGVLMLYFHNQDENGEECRDFAIYAYDNLGTILGKAQGPVQGNNLESAMRFFEFDPSEARWMFDGEKWITSTITGTADSLDSFDKDIKGWLKSREDGKDDDIARMGNSGKIKYNLPSSASTDDNSEWL